MTDSPLTSPRRPCDESRLVCSLSLARARAGRGRIALAVAVVLVALVAFLTPREALARPAAAPPALTADDLAGLVARPVEVHFPVAIDGETAAPAALRGLSSAAARPSAPLRSGPVIVGPREAALVRAPSLGVLRLRTRPALGGTTPKATGEAAEGGAKGGRSAPRLRRLQGEPGGSWLAIDEAAIEVSPGTWLIEQPPGGPGYWLISADGPLEVAVEAVEARRGDLIWEDRAAALLAWIDAGGPMPGLPEVVGAERLRRALQVDAEIAAEIARRNPGDPRLQRAVRGWRSAAALQHLAVARDLRRAGFGVELRPRALAGTDALAGDAPRARAWRRRQGDGRWTLELAGPGLLVVDARLLGAGPDGQLEVVRDGQRLGRADLLAAHAPLTVPKDMSHGKGLKEQVLEDMNAAPPAGLVAEAGDGDDDADDADDEDLAAAATDAPRGPRGEVRVPLAPGRHRYELRFTGREAALRVRVGRESPRLAAALRGETVPAAVRRARRALRGSTSPDAPLVAALLDAIAGAKSRAAPEAAQDPKAGPRGPILDLAAELLRAREADLSPAERRRRARALARAADRTRSRPLAWEARARGLELIAGLYAPRLARALGGSEPAEAPTAVLYQLARAVEGPPLLARSPALAVLGRARRLRPLDPGVRDVFRERWRGGTRWSTLHADDPAGDPWLWIEPRAGEARGDRRPAKAHEEEADDDDTSVRAAPTSALWTWPLGQARRVRAAPSPVDPAHPALFRVYARTDAPAAPLSLAVDGRRWHTLALRPMQAMSVALPPGAHEATIDAPAGARVFASLPPRPGQAPDARLLRMWPIRRGEALRFVLPGGDIPGFVRVELRGLAPDLPARVRLQVVTDVGEPREIEVDLVADGSIAAAEAPAAAGARARVVLPIEPRARALSVRLVDGAPVVAASAALRSTRGPELPAPTPRRSAPPPPQGEAALLAEVAQASRGLEDDPDDRHLRIKRAAALLELDQRGLALVDWGRIVAGDLPPALLPEVLALAARFDAHDAPTHIDLRAEAPTLVAPALAAVVGDAPGRLDPLKPAIEAAWRGGPEAGLGVLGVAPAGEDEAATAVATTGPSGDRGEEGESAHHLSEEPGDPATRHLAAPTGAAGDGEDPPTSAESGALEDMRGSAHHLAKETGTKAPKGRGDRSRRTGEVAAGADPRTEALAADPVAGALAATWLADAGRPRESALLWARIAAREEVWQADLAAVDGFLAALDRDGPAAGAGLAHGVALALAPSVHTPAVRRLRAVTAARSRWTRVLGAEHGGGGERLHVPLAATLPAPSVAVQRALMTPPWPHVDGVHLSPGYATVVELRRGSPQSIAVDLWCQALRPDLGDGAPARVRVHVDGKARHDGPVAEGEVVTIRGGTLASGTHRVEVELAPESRAHRCAARVREHHGRDDALGSRRPTRWWVARPDESVLLVVTGPTTLALEVRAQLPGGARSVALALGRGDDPVRDLGVMDLPQVADPEAAPELSRPIQPGLEAIRVISVVDPGPHRLRIRATGGAALVRVLDRADGGDPPPARPTRPPLALGALAHDVGAIELPPLRDARIAATPPAGRFGTVTSDLWVGTDDLEDADDLEPRPGARLRVGYARELLPRRLWLSAHGEVRPRQATALTGGGGLSIQGVIPRTGLRVSVGALALAQAYGDGQAWSLRGHLHVDRPTWIAPRLQLLPRLDVLGRLQSVTPDTRVPDEAVHPRVYQRYVADHPFVLLPGLDLRIQPWRDARVILGAEAAPNSDMQSLDHASAAIGFHGALALRRRIVPEFWIEEQLSYRLADADRSQAFLRSRLRAGVGVGFWASRSARIVVGGADTLYTSTRFPLRNVFELWLRVDFVFGRGLRDLGPLGVAFRPIREHRLWHEVTP